MNYVCSDIHGNLTRFNKLVDMLKTGDHLYILGDCIDRGGMVCTPQLYMMGESETEVVIVWIEDRFCR